MTEKFNLKWNDFKTNVSNSFGLFRNESYLHDVTLVSDDYKHIKAHKLVLSASSEYFKNILQETDQSQPLLCLDGVSSVDLQNVLDYVYNGEVKIHQEDLDRFLNVAQRLKLEGLISNDSHENIREDTIEEDIASTVEQKTAKDCKSLTVRTRPKSNEVVGNLIALQDGKELTEEEHKQRLANNVIINDDGTASCKVCGKLFGGRPDRAKSNAKIHVETHIDGLSYSCHQCDKTFRLKNSLACHKSKHHKQ